MKKRVLAGLISSILVVSSFGLQVFAEPATDITEEQQKNIDENTENLTKAEKELKEMEAKLESIGSEMDLAQAQIDSTDENLQKKQKEIDSSNTEIEQLKDDIDEKQVVLGDRLNSIYKAGGTNSYLQILLSSDSISDFIGRAGAVNEILGLDKKALEEVQSKSDQLSRRVEKLSKDQEEIKRLEKENKEKIVELKEKEKELDKLAEEYRKKYNSADIDLFESEKALYSYWKGVIENKNSTVDDINKSVAVLTTLKDKVKSSKSKAAIDELIAKGQKLIKTKDFAAKAGIDVSSASSKAIDLLVYAYGFLGRPYVWGATGPNAFDCSGFTGYVFRHVGISLPRVTYDQQHCGVPVSRSELQPGDLILTRISSRGPEHVGIYVGNGQMIHAANPAVGVKVGPMYEYGFARRIL